MNRSLILDLVAASTIVVASLRGWTRKSIREAFSLLGLIVAITLVVVALGPASALVDALSPADTDVSRVIAAGVLALIGLIGGAIIGYRVSKGTTIPGPRRFDSVGGVAFAFVRAVTLLSVILFSLDATWGQPSVGHRMIADSFTGTLLTGNDSPFGTFYGSLVDGSSDIRALRSWAQRDEEPVGYIQTELQATDERLEVDSAAERAMLNAINAERETRGLEPLEWCERCALVARAHSKDMYRDGYFSHEDLEGNDPFDRMTEAEIAYGAAGENLALAPTIDEAVAGLMRSQDHQANILRRSFDQIGIGIYAGPYGLMCTQVFRALP